MDNSTDVTVMIIDDHPVVRSGLVAMLSTQPGITVVASASNALEALSLLESQTPDVVLMDLRMPGMGGPEAIQAINSRKHPPRIIVLTSFSTDEEIYQSINAGAYGYLLKNTSQDRLLTAIRMVQQGKRHFPDFIVDQLAQRMARASLTPRETEVLQLVAKGLTNKEIGRVFGIAENTARNHVNHVIEKLEVSDRTEAVTIAIRQGIISITE